jgi:hypothetical protein
MRALVPLGLLFACGSESPATDAGSGDAGEVAGAHRVMLVVQNSNSMAAADPDRRRKALVEEAFAELPESARIGAVVYSDGFREASFVAEAGDAQVQFLLARLEAPENLGVLDGAMRRAKELVLEAKEAEPDPALSWSVVIMTDGFPTPTCTASPNDISPLCETPRDQWAMFGVDLSDTTLFYGYEGAGGAYNQRLDAISRAEELLPFARTHVILLYTEAIVGQPIEAALGLNRVECAAFAALLAQAGGGNVVVEDGADIDWNVLLE